MDIDFGPAWKIIVREPPFSATVTLDYAARELARAIGNISGSRAQIGGDGSGARLMILDCGWTTEQPAKAPGAYRWRAAPDRVELFGDDPASLLHCVFDFLRSAGFEWVAPGRTGERGPASARVSLRRDCGSRSREQPACTMILGHGSYMDHWDEMLTWAARNGYTSAFFHTTEDPLAFGAIPLACYESARRDIEARANKLGLRLELGGHALNALLPRSLFREKPDLFRMSEGRRTPSGNLCPSNPEALETAAQHLVRFARAHPEVSVFHCWPADVPGGAWCSCPACQAQLPDPRSQSLTTYRHLATALAATRPDARLSFLAYHDTGDLDGLELATLPPTLDLLWAPRRRSWAFGLDDRSCPLNLASAAAFRSAAARWRGAGGGAISVFEYWEDGLLFKGAVPPLFSALTGDLAVYAGHDGPAAATSIGMLFTGGRMPESPRPNAWLLPRLLLEQNPGSARETWLSATYGPAAAAMASYWKALESAWSLVLDIEASDCELHMPAGHGAIVDDPPADWGDPWKASAERLDILRERCESLFDRLREAEAALARGEEAAGTDTPASGALSRERGEYGIVSTLLELNCARLAVYHELASGDGPAAADLGLLGLATLSAFSSALSAVRDRRSRRELRFSAFVNYGLRFHAIRRANTRNPLRRLFDRSWCLARLAFGAVALRNAWKSPPPAAVAAASLSE